MRRLTVTLTTIFALCAPTISLAAEPLSADAFDKLTKGRTLTYFSNGRPYGVEYYMPGNRVMWSFLDGQCQDGTWYQSGSHICFEYENSDGAQCWKFFADDGKLTAVFGDGGVESTPYLADETAEDIECLGPKIGV